MGSFIGSLFLTPVLVVRPKSTSDQPKAEDFQRTSSRLMLLDIGKQLVKTDMVLERGVKSECNTQWLTEKTVKCLPDSHFTSTINTLGGLRQSAILSPISLNQQSLEIQARVKKLLSFFFNEILSKSISAPMFKIVCLVLHVQINLWRKEIAAAASIMKGKMHAAIFLITPQQSLKCPRARCYTAHMNGLLLWVFMRTS